MRARDVLAQVSLCTRTSFVTGGALSCALLRSSCRWNTPAGSSYPVISSRASSPRASLRQAWCGGETRGERCGWITNADWSSALRLFRTAGPSRPGQVGALTSPAEAGTETSYSMCTTAYALAALNQGGRARAPPLCHGVLHLVILPGEERLEADAHRADLRRWIHREQPIMVSSPSAARTGACCRWELGDAVGANTHPDFPPAHVPLLIVATQQLRAREAALVAAPEAQLLEQLVRLLVALRGSKDRGHKTPQRECPVLFQSPRKPSGRRRG